MFTVKPLVANTQNNLEKIKTASLEERKIIEKLASDFYENSQLIIEKYYLQPLTQNKDGHALPLRPRKVNLKDGVLEREQHGGMHVGRSQFHVKVIHKKLQEWFPESNYVQSCLKELASVLDLNEAEILILIRYGVLFHDSARLHEATDLWDKESAENCAVYFMEKGLSRTLAYVITKAAAFKDTPKEYQKFLLAIGVEENKIDAFQYLRKLIFMSDCHDIIRCTGKFSISFPLKALKDIPGYKPEIHIPLVVKFSDEVRKLTIMQGDLFFDSQITLTTDELEIYKKQLGNTNVLKSQASYYSLEEKVQFEHANNVCSAIGESIRKIPYFESYFSDEEFVDLNKNTVTRTPSQNPLIHGTNSSFLVLLPKTNFQLMSPMDMLEKYKLSPMNGEIEQGGLRNLKLKSMPAFGRIINEPYDKERIINNYAKMVFVEPNLDSFEEKVEKYFGSNISRINELLIHVERAKQWGVKIEESKQLKNLQKEIHFVQQLYYFLLCISDYSKPILKSIQEKNFKGLLDLGELDPFWYDSYSFDAFKKHIENNKLDMKQIWEKPTQTELDKLNQIFKLKHEDLELDFFNFQCPPEKKTTQEQEYHDESEVEVSFDCFTRFFSDKSYHGKEGLPGALKQHLQCLSYGREKSSFLSKIRPLILDYLDVFQEKTERLQNMMETTQNEITLLDPEKKLISKAFPIILVCENENLVNRVNHEYRAIRPLTLGKDILIIATDTNEHKEYLINYFDEHKIANMQIILFDQLQPGISTKSISQRLEQVSAQIISNPTTQTTNESSVVLTFSSTAAVKTTGNPVQSNKNSL